MGGSPAVLLVGDSSASNSYMVSSTYRSLPTSTIPLARTQVGSCDGEPWERRGGRRVRSVDPLTGAVLGHSRSAIFWTVGRLTLAAQVVRRCRLRRNLSQGQLAALAGTTQSAISRLESGASVPSFDRVADLVELMGLSLDSVLMESDWDDAAITRNLRLTPQDRWDNAVSAAQFIERGREEVRLRRVRPR